MLRLTATASFQYDLDVTNSRGPPIAEAGFTITGLTPTFSNSTGQQQNFVLLGGHTQTAFINMSQLAIWSLPEESWTFVTVDSPSSSNPNTELAVKSVVTSVDSRSGHTAVLTEDGSKIIVLGGWVGDAGQAADPQLAVLELGTGYGGSGDWEWSVPPQQPSGTGLYGHGAVMLPGNVMMVLGGYNVSSSTNSKRASTPGTQAMFFNATSLTWGTEYTNPEYIAAIASGVDSSSKSNSKKLGIGLGLGLGLGLLAILIAIAVCFWYNRHLKKIREAEREKHIQSLSTGAANFYSPTREMGQRAGGFPWAEAGYSHSGEDDVLHDSTSTVAGYENLHAGVHALGDHGIPPPPRQITRKPLHARTARGMYQPTPNFENHGRANSLGTAGPIHPIYEADEDDHHSNISDIGVGVAFGDPSSVPTSTNPNRHSDPFRDPPINYSAPLHHEEVSPDSESPARSREREIQEWVSDWAAADALLASQSRSHSAIGRVSPTRRAQLIAASNVSSVSGEEDSGRTASNLSERSVAISAMTVSRSGSSSQRSRSNSLRGFLANAINPFTSTIPSNTVGSSTISPVFDASGRGQPPRSAGSGSSSFNTAHTSFPALQAEGESLLPRPDDGWHSDNNSPTRLTPEPGSPSKSRPLAQSRTGWLGSLKRAFVGEAAGGNGSPTSGSFGNRTPSPVRIEQAIAAPQPRRTVSAGATLWRRKQGRGDWEDSADTGPHTPRSNTITGDLHTMASASGSGAGIGGHEPFEDDEEWDIERAVQNRVVQVMFTVPKEKLRVVNHDVSEDGSDIGSLRSKKGSNKSLNEPLAQAPALESVVEGKGKQEELVEEPQPRPSPEGKGKGKEKGRVLEIVQSIEGRSGSPSPERS